MSEDFPLWSFSLETYGQPGVAEACLELQENCGVDVNVLLYLLWVGAQGRRMSAAEVDAALELVAAWSEEVVKPLRRARRAAKTPQAGFVAESTSQLRLQIKRLELEAERAQQETLQLWRSTEALGARDAPARAARANVELYAAALGVKFREALTRRLVSAALPRRFEGEARER